MITQRSASSQEEAPGVCLCVCGGLLQTHTLIHTEKTHEKAEKQTQTTTHRNRNTQNTDASKHKLTACASDPHTDTMNGHTHTHTLVGNAFIVQLCQQKLLPHSARC